MNETDTIFWKRCTCCKEDRLIEAFNKSLKAKDGRASWCCVCFAEYHSRWRAKKKTRHVVSGYGSKECTKCKRNLPLGSFGIDKRRLDWRRSRCKRCTAFFRNRVADERRRFLYLENPENKARVAVYQKTYYAKNKGRILAYAKKWRRDRMLQKSNEQLFFIAHGDPRLKNQRIRERRLLEIKRERRDEMLRAKAIFDSADNKV